MNLIQDLNDKRNSGRVEFKLPVRISGPHLTNPLDGTLINLSVHGMLVDFDSSMANLNNLENSAATIIFQGISSRLVIEELHFRIARIDGHRLAMEFTEPLEWFLLFSVYRGKQLNE
jgi:hypothetical protein